MKCRIRSLYLCVTDMARAIDFYENLLEQSITEKDDIYSVFDLQGFRLGLFAYQRMNEKHEYGNNCLPSIEFEDIDVLKEKMKCGDIVFPLTQIKQNWVGEIVDSEGNHIELTAPIQV